MHLISGQKQFLRNKSEAVFEDKAFSFFFCLLLIMTSIENLQEVLNKSSLKGEDYIQYSVFLSPKAQDMYSYLQDTLDMINSLIQPIVKDYIWQKDRFHLSIVNEHSRGSYKKEKDKSDDQRLIATLDPSYPFLYGLCRFGDCINDEWFIVYLLHQISNKIPDAVISLCDNDGDVLLIEAALELPSWLDPSNSQNRVYLHQGKLHIIPLPTSPANILQFPASLSKERAIEMIRKQPSISIAESNIQRAIRSRIAAYPQAATEEIHRADCLLPKKAAFVLLKEPQLITLATEAFYLRDPISMKACASMSMFPPAEGNVQTTLRFTRTTYAQIVNQKFYAPKPFRLPSVNDKRKFRYAELGMKAACGLEMLYQQTRDNKNEEHYDFEKDKKFAAYLDHLVKLGYFRNEKKGSQLYSALEKQAREQYLIYQNEKESTKYVSLNDVDIEDEDITKPSIDNVRTKIDKLLLEYTEEELDKLIESNTDEADSDDWMSVDPQQLEELLFKRMMKDNSMFSDLEKSIQSESGMNLEAIMSNLEHFVENGTSGLEGVDINELDEEDYDEESYDEDSECEIKFDYNKFMHILKGKGEYNSVHKERHLFVYVR